MKVLVTGAAGYIGIGPPCSSSTRCERASTSLMRSGPSSPPSSLTRATYADRVGHTRSATRANVAPMAAPAITSEAWCTWTCTRLVATTAAIP